MTLKSVKRKFTMERMLVRDIFFHLPINIIPVVDILYGNLVMEIPLDLVFIKLRQKILNDY